MPNSLLTINMITREAVRLFKNTNLFIQNIDTQYDSMFANAGAKIGTSVRVRLPNDYTVSNGPALSAQNTDEQSTTLNLSTQRHVDVGFTSVDLTMSLDDFSSRVLAPMVNNLAGNVAQTIMLGSEGGVCNFVSNVDGAGNIITAQQNQYLVGRAILADNSAPLTEGANIVVDPITNANSTSSLTGLLNPSTEISEQYRTGMMKNGLGYRRWFEDQTVIKHTTGTYDGTATVGAAGQTGNSIVTTAPIVGTLNAGDIITLQGCNAVNRVTKQDLATLRQFVVTANVSSGATSIPIYPSITPAVGGQPVQYQTVTASPTSGGQILLVTKAGEVYRKSIAYVRDAVTMATADLVMPKAGIVAGARSNYDGIAMRMITAYQIGTDQEFTRLDVLFGWLYVRPEWAVVVANKV